MTLGLGDIIQILLEITGERSFRLANYLGYDVSYISKWISGKKFPSEKNIDEVLDKICEFFTKDIDEKNIQKICFELDLDFNKSSEDLNEDTKHQLKNIMYSSFENQIKSKSKDDILLNNNTSMLIGKKDVSRWIHENLKSYCKRSKEKDIHIIITHDIRDYIAKKSVIDISNEKSYVFDKKNVYINQIINLNNLKNNINEYCKIVLMYLNQDSGVNYSLYCSRSNLNVVIVKNCLSSVNICDENCNSNITYISKDVTSVNNLYMNYGEFLKNQSPIFEIQSVEKLVEQKYFINYIMESNLKLIFRNMHTIFMPREILSKIKQDYSLESTKSEDLFSMMNVCIPNIKIKIIIYKSALLNYIFDGNINIFNKNINIDKEDRIKHLDYMVSILKSNANVEIKLLENDNPIIASSDLDNSVFLNKKSCFILKENDDNSYFKFTNEELIYNFNEFFDNLWKAKEIHLSKCCDVIEFIEKGRELLTQEL